jgi:site-specific DNA recombinase
MYAEMKGWKVGKVYRLDAISGKSVMGRPETAEMLDDVREGRISGLIFSKLARLARNTKELLEFADIFRQEGADLISLAESIDTSSPAGRFFYTLLAALAEWEREEISARIAASVPIRARLGKQVAGKPPFGYHWVEGRLVPHPEEAPILKLAFELFSEHRLIGRVARLLNEAGYRATSGKKFCDTSVRRLLTNPVAKGLRLANYSRSDGVKRLLKPESEWVWVPVEPVVSEELWDECNAYLTDRAAKYKRIGRPAVQLFSGVVFCYCGTKMYVPSNTPKYVCKRNCLNKIPIVDLERVFHEKLRDFFLDPEQLAGYLSEGDEVLREKQELLTTLERERSRIAAEAEKLYRLYQDDQLSPKSFGERHRPLEERIQQLDDEIPKLQGEIDFLTIQKLSSADFATEAGNLYSRWPELSFEERRQIVEHVVDQIVVGKGEIEIKLAYTPPTPPSPVPPSRPEVGRQVDSHRSSERRSSSSSRPFSHKNVAKSRRTQITVVVWSTSRRTFRCATSGWGRGGNRRGARAPCWSCPVPASAFSRPERRPRSAAGASGSSIPRPTSGAGPTSAPW